jgi:hypothetical protein
MAERQYVAVVARELGRHAVWQPGLQLEIGDYGRMEGGLFGIGGSIFVKLGNIADFGITQIKKTASEKMGWSFTSNGMKTAFIKGDIAGGVGETKLQIQCGSKESLFIRSAKSVVEQVDNLQIIADALQKIDKWKSHWKLIRELRRVQDGLVLVSNSGGGTIELTGGLKEIQGLDQIGAKAGAGIRISGATSDRYSGINGPLLIGLVRIIKNPFFGGDSAKEFSGTKGIDDRRYRIEEVVPGVGLKDDPQERA